MGCLSLEPRREKFIKELLGDNLLTMVKVVRPIDVAQWQIEQGTQCYIHYLEDHWVIIVHFL